MAVSAELSAIDFTDLGNFANGFPHELFAIHRRVAPVFWHEPTEHTPDGEGFWPVASYAETFEVRTATRSAMLGGQRIVPGQKVLVWEGSANRDGKVFDRPDEFDISRKPNPHLGFGHGVHFCLGAHLARLELRVLFEELLARFDDVRVVAPVEWTRSNRHTGIRHLVVELRGAS
jgi:hypothetical protein